MKRRDCWVLGFVLTLGGLALANPTAAEQARIDKLIQAVAHRTDIKFVRNGSEYSSVQAGEFLQGKLKWRLSKVSSAQDFIVQIGTRSTSSGDIYQVRLSDGRMVPSAVFLQQELERIERRR